MAAPANGARYWLQFGDDPRDVRLLLTDRHVDIVKRTIILVARGFRRLVAARLIDHRVHADGRLPGRTVANDQLALSPPNRDHRVNGHDAGLHRLADRFSFDDARGDFLDWVEGCFLNRPLVVDGLAERIHHPAEQAFADRH